MLYNGLTIKLTTEAELDAAEEAWSLREDAFAIGGKISEGELQELDFAWYRLEGDKLP